MCLNTWHLLSAFTNFLKVLIHGYLADLNMHGLTYTAITLLQMSLRIKDLQITNFCRIGYEIKFDFE